jgi:hypothetical protein
MTGQGSELGMNLSDPARAFKEYGRRIRGFVEQSQQIPAKGYAPFIASPRTWYTTQGIFARTKLWKLILALERKPFHFPKFKFR